MAETWTALSPATAFAAGKNMLSILNTHATEIIRIRRAGLINVQTSTVTGQLCQLDCRLYNGTATLTGSTTITPVTHDSTNTSPASITVGTGGTLGGTSNVLRRNIWSSDEPAFSGTTIDELEGLPLFGLIWDAGYADSSVQALTLRQDQMFTIYNVAGTAGAVDVWIEYTKE